MILGIFCKTQRIDVSKARIILILSFFRREDPTRPSLTDYYVKLDPLVVTGSFFCFIKC